MKIDAISLVGKRLETPPEMKIDENRRPMIGRRGTEGPGEDPNTPLLRQEHAPRARYTTARTALAEETLS